MGTEDRSQQVKKWFRRLDRNGSGTIERLELEVLFHDLDKNYWTDDRLAQLMDQADTTGDGKIDSDEFVSWVFSREDADAETGLAVAFLELEDAPLESSASFVADHRHRVADDSTVMVEIVREDGGKAIGLKVAGSDRGTLLIKDILQTGLVADWLADHRHKEIAIGDRIVAVNGATGDEKKLKRQLCVEGKIELQVQRGAGACSFSEKLSDYYDVERSPMMEGSFGKVFKASDKTTSALFAVQSFPKSRTPPGAFTDAVEVMKRANHPHILRLHSAFEDYLEYHLVMDMCEPEPLLDLILRQDGFSERTVSIIMKQIFAAVVYLHSLSVCHREIAPEVVFVIDPDALSVRLGGMAHACFVKKGVCLHWAIGSPHYAAPEVFVGCGYWLQADLWSCGILMYLLLCGYTPFSAESDHATRYLAAKTSVKFPDCDWSIVSKEAKLLISKLLSKSPDDRGTALETLDHAWIREHGPQAMVQPLMAVQGRLREFLQESRFKAVALNALVASLPQNTLGDLQAKFQLMDSNGDCSISLGELKTSLDEFGEVDPESACTLAEILKSTDIDGNKRMDYTEFCAATLNKKIDMVESACWEAFCKFDFDRDGSIDRKELAEVLASQEVGEAVGSEAVNNALSQCDTNGDGLISFDEFLALLHSDGSKLHWPTVDVI